MSENRLKKWDLSQLPDLQNKVVIITGGNAGLGYQSSFELAKRGATVVIACRDKEKGQKAINDITVQLPSAKLDTIALNLIDLYSIKRFSEIFKTKYSRLDVLLNNAGVVNLLNREVTSNNQEMHMATNHFGHFALTGRLFPLLTDTKNSRVVTVSSLAWKSGTIDFKDLNWVKRPYHRIKAYGDSKLANLLFMLQLQKKFEITGATSISVAAHPGLSSTERQQSSYIGITKKLVKLIATPATKGCLPMLRAATDLSVKPLEFYGPKHLIRGHPTPTDFSRGRLDNRLAESLWKISEKITDVRY